MEAVEPNDSFDDSFDSNSDSDSVEEEEEEESAMPDTQDWPEEPFMHALWEILNG